MRQGRPRLRILLALTVGGQMLASPCRAQSDPADPWERTNRAFFAIESALDRTVLGPVAFLFGKLPKPLRKAARNVSRNLGEPLVMVNDLLQGHVGTAASTAGRFVINSTVGVAGLVDVAKRGRIPHHDNGFGLTLGRWGAQPGPYLFLPLVGPSTLRDSVGGLADIGLNPLNYAQYHGKTAVSTSTAVVGGIGRRADAQQELETVGQTSTDPYATIRSYYLQSRAAEVRGPAADIGELPSFDTPDVATPPPPPGPDETPSSKGEIGPPAPTEPAPPSQPPSQPSSQPQPQSQTQSQP